jgi:hypothetical protein
MKSTLFFTLTLLSPVILAQDYSTDFGKITTHELVLKSYPKDPDASAAILYDIGETRFLRDYNDNFILELERSTKIKIFNESGFYKGEWELHFYTGQNIPEEIEIVKATTYNMDSNNRITTNELNKKNIYTEKISENWSALKFAMPNIQKGSIIEVKYKYKTPDLFRYHDWQFQYDIPVRYSKYIAHMIPFYSYNYIMQGKSKFDSFNSYEDKGLKRQYGAVEFNDNIYEFVMQNVPAFKDEGYITSIEDYIMKIDFQLSSIHQTNGAKIDYLTTWPEMSKRILKEQGFGKYIHQAMANTKDITAEIIAKSNSDKEIVENICDYVKSNYNWDKRNRFMTEKKVPQFMTEKTGSSAEINLFLLGMLNNTDITAKPVILSTRDHGKIKSDFPFISFFNYVVILVSYDDKNILLDATNPLLPYYIIPPNCLNEQGLLLDKKEPFWIQLQGGTPSFKSHVFLLSPRPGVDSLQLHVATSASLYDANRLRSIVQNDEKLLTKYVEEKGINLTDKPKATNYFKKNNNFSITYNGTLPLGHIGNKIYISPFLQEPVSVNPFQSAERKYPVDMIYSRTREFKSIIEIPEGYKADYIPEATKIDNDIIELRYNTNSIDDDKKLVINASYTFKKAVYNEKEYKLLRYYYIQLIKLLNDKISLIPTE